MIDRRYVIHTCPECQGRFTERRQVKYCSDACRAKAVRRRNAEYERRVKRPPHLYRKKKLAEGEIQLELALDSTRTVEYEKAS